jgi:uncharacterized membrane protein YeaQ/YmgE (transglycosylase-associated protein family)
MDFIGDILAAPFVCVGWIIIGAIAGALARTILKSPDMSFISDMLLGIVGAFVGGFLAGLVGLAPGADTAGLELVLANLVIATVGAMVLIAIGRMISGRNVTP